MTLALPAKPLLAPWYRIVEDGDRLLLEHRQSVVILEGGAVQTLLPALLPLLDGTRSVEEVVLELGVTARAAIEGAVQTLAASGLLVDGPAEPPPARATVYALAAAFELAPSVAADRLRAAVVGVAGASPVGGEVARLLHRAGIGEVRRIGRKASAAVDLAVVAPAPDETGELGFWNRRALDDRFRWLPVRPYDGRLTAVGPLVVPGESCCYECVLLRRAANLEYGDDLARVEAVPVAAGADPALEALAAAFVAHLVLRVLIGRDAGLPGVLYALADRAAPRLTEHHVLRVPRCPACSPANRAASPLPWHGATAA